MQAQSKPSRRGFVLGATIAGAAAAAVTALPKVQAEAAAADVSEPRPTPEKGGGYHVSEHVKRYYKTTAV